MSPLTAVRKPRKRLASLLCHDEGTVAVITALTIIPLVLSMGLAIDLTRAYMLRAKLSAALDAAGLAVGGNPSLSATQAASLAQSFLQANMPNSSSVTVNSPTVNSTNTTVTVSATATMTTSFMGLIGFNTLPISSQSTVTFAQTQGLEVALVLDNTGSLNYVDSSTGQTNIQALKTAAGHLVLTLFGTTPTNNSGLRVGIVPYVAAVNPGSVASGMLKNPPTLTPSDPTGWTGCVVERGSTFPLASLSTLTYTQVATDLDTPVSASANNYLTQYYWPQTGHASGLNWTSSTINKGPFKNGVSAAGPNQSCPTPVVPLTNSAAPLLASIGTDASGTGIANQGMEAWDNGGTIGSIGMSWGYRMLSPNGPYAAAGEAVSNWNTATWQKVVVLMTDGVNNINYNSGIEDYNGAPAGANPTVSQVDKEEELVCDALRSKGVTIYSVFLNSNSTPGPALAYCAGTKAGSGDSNYYYNAQNQTLLYQYFSTIAKSLSKLRISQ